MTTILFAAVGMVCVYLTLAFDSPTTLILGLVIFFLLLPLSLFAYLQARKDNVERCVVWTVTVWYLIAFAMALVGSRVYALFSVCTIMPVLIAMPFVSKRNLQRIILVTLTIIVLGSILAMFPPIIEPTVPDRFVFYVDVVFVPLLAGIFVLSVWQSGGRLQALEARTRELNAAKEQFSTLVENIPGAVYRVRFDQDFTAIFYSEYLINLTGYPPQRFHVREDEFSRFDSSR